MRFIWFTCDSIVHSCVIGLSKNERPILDHHTKAHNFEIQPQPYKVRCFNKNSSVWGVHGGGYDPGFHEIQGNSSSPAFIKLDSFGWKHLLLQGLGWISHEIHWISPEDFMWISWNLADFIKSGGFQSKDPLARNCNPVFYFSTDFESQFTWRFTSQLTL